MTELHKLAQAMCSVDLADSFWTQELPRLPVPDLGSTIDKYLASLKAVLAPNMDSSRKDEISGLTSEHLEANRNQFLRTQQLVKQFMFNEGPQLQRDLKEYANKSQNWATDYWLQDMYLSNPIPLPVNSNPFFMFPRQQFKTSEEMLMFATRIIQFSVDFKYRIDQQTLRQDFGSGHGKGKPLCMETYKNFFHSYRMPHEDVDRLLPQSRRSNHIVVASCNQFYILRLGQDPLPDPYRKDASAELSESIIFDQLLRIYRISREQAKRQLLTGNDHDHDPDDGQGAMKANERRIPKVGLFTAENRKVWAKWHKRLSHFNGSQANSLPNTNSESLRLIEDCLFVMCLDSLVHPSPLPHHHLASRKGDCVGRTTSSSNNNNKQETIITNGKTTYGPEAAGDSGTDGEVEAANIILTGGGSNKFTANRWFDKFLQIIVGRDGICGINIEHSASEGITVLRFLEEFLEFIRSNPIEETKSTVHHHPQLQQQQTNHQLEMVPETCDEKQFTFATGNHHQHDHSGSSNGSNCQMLEPAVPTDSITSAAYVEPVSPNALLKESDKITPLMWSLDQELEGAIEMAEERANKLVEDFSLNILRFDQFGRQFIKSQKLSPDAFIQLALQLTFFKIHGFLVSTYESASLRQFRLGRVDNIRANTCEAYHWIQAMLACKNRKSETERETKSQPNLETLGDGDDQNTRGRWLEAVEPFMKAIRRQVEILKYTITGTGPDNHLLALKQLANIRYDDEMPQLFTDPSYGEFNNFRLSTSQLPNESGIIVGYGAVVPDGYGCSYNPSEGCIIFCISSFVSCPLTSSSKFASILTESLLEMRQLCLSSKLAEKISS